MPTTTVKAMRLLAELVDLDRMVRTKRQPLDLAQRQRRMAITQELHLWALARQPTGPYSEQRKHPRASLRLRCQLLGGPKPMELESDSVAVGGLSVNLTFTPRLGDLFGLRLSPIDDQPFEAMSEVVWFDPVRSRAGLRFIDLSEDTRAILERLVFSDLLKDAKR